MKRMHRLLILMFALFSITAFASGCSPKEEEPAASIEASTNKTLYFDTEKQLTNWLKGALDTGVYYMPVLNDNVKLKSIEVVGMVTYKLSVTAADGKNYDCSLTWTMEGDGYAYLSQTKEKLGLKNWNGLDGVYYSDSSVDHNSIYWVYDDNVFNLIVPIEMSVEDVTKLFELETKSY